MFVLFLSFNIPTYGENRAIIYGGNDDPKDLFNQFLPNMTSLSKALKAHQWNVLPLYGSDIRSRCTLSWQDDACKSQTAPADCCPADINPKYWNVSNFTKILKLKTSDIDFASKESLLRSLLKARAELSVKSQLLIAIDTHGNPGRFRGASGDVVYDDPEIQEALRSLQKKGIRLGFLLGSCYSGSGIPALSQFGCVLTSSDAAEVAYYQWRRDWKTSTLQSGQKYTEENYTFDSAWNGHARLLELALRNRTLTLTDLFVGDLVRNARSCYDGWKTSNPQISGFSFDPKIASTATAGLLSYLKFIREAVADPIVNGKGIQSIMALENSESIELKNQRPECHQHYIRALTFIQQKDKLMNSQNPAANSLKACDEFRLTGASPN